MSAASSPPSSAQVNLERDLIDGGLTLIAEKSGLVRWSQAEPRLIPIPHAEFETWLLGRGDFARLASWVLFGVGAEYLAKGVCLAHQVGPEAKLNNHGYLNMGTLGPYCIAAGGDTPYLARLDLPAPGRKAICDAYKRISKLRNRDVHTLNAGVRAGDLPYVEKDFVPAFNLLLDTLLPASPLGKIVERRWRGGLSGSSPHVPLPS